MKRKIKNTLLRFLLLLTFILLTNSLTAQTRKAKEELYPKGARLKDRRPEGAETYLQKKNASKKAKSDTEQKKNKASSAKKNELEQRKKLKLEQKEQRRVSKLQ